MTIKKVLIYAEIFDGAISPSYHELLSKAKALFAGREIVYAAAYAAPKHADLTEAIRNSGVHALYRMESPLLAVYHPEYHAKALEALVRMADPDVLLIAETSAGEELAPALGVRFRTGVTAHCADLILKADGELAQMVPAFGGKVIGEIFTPKTRPKIVGVKPGMFVASEVAAEACTVVDADPAILAELTPAVEVLSVERKSAPRLPVTAADVVICGGFGMGAEEDFKILEELADRLSGAVAGTRPAADAGLIEDESSMIGTSGKSVRPKLYMGFGISGAAHHVCGIKDAGTIISVNNDPDAEIFSVSDYKVVGDAPAIARAVLERLGGR
jgi:electron transfer flavoprotein alpha subunit